MGHCIYIVTLRVVLLQSDVYQNNNSEFEETENGIVFGRGSYNGKRELTKELLRIDWGLYTTGIVLSQSSYESIIGNESCIESDSY